MCMREIEVKAKINDLPKLLKRCREQGILLSDSEREVDTLFSVIPNFYEEREKGILPIGLTRVREKGNGEVTITYKKHQTGIHLDKVEYEVTTSDAKNAKAIFEAIGLIPILVMEKTRQKAHIGEYEVCLDEVAGLGTYIEIEKLLPESDTTPGEEVQRELWEVLSSLGVSREDEVLVGYDILKYEADKK